jgi:hypothetical protein
VLRSFHSVRRSACILTLMSFPFFTLKPGGISFADRSFVSSVRPFWKFASYLVAIEQLVACNGSMMTIYGNHPLAFDKLLPF